MSGDTETGEMFIGRCNDDKFSLLKDRSLHFTVSRMKKVFVLFSKLCSDRRYVMVSERNLITTTTDSISSHLYTRVLRTYIYAALYYSSFILTIHMCGICARYLTLKLLKLFSGG